MMQYVLSCRTLTGGGPACTSNAGLPIT